MGKEKIKIDQVMVVEQCVGHKGCIFADNIGEHYQTFQCGVVNKRIPLEGMQEKEMAFPDFCPLHRGKIIIEKR